METTCHLKVTDLGGGVALAPAQMRIFSRESADGKVQQRQLALEHRGHGFEGAGFARFLYERSQLGDVMDTFVLRVIGGARGFSRVAVVWRSAAMGVRVRTVLVLVVLRFTVAVRVAM